MKTEIKEIETIRIVLVLSRNLMHNVEINFNELPKSLNKLTLENIGELTIINVPLEAEDSLSKMIFNRLTINELKAENEKYIFQVINHLPYHAPEA